MRFGIITMQREALVPSGMSMAEAMNYIATLDHADLARRLHSHGFNPIELGGDMQLFLPQSFDRRTIEKLARMKAGSDIEYTVHLPLWSVEPSTPLSAVREGSVQALVDTIERTLILDPELYVLHATGPLAAEFYMMNLPDLAKGLILRQFQGHARDSIRSILAQTGIPSRKIAIETIEFPFDLTLELANQLDLSLCLDVGHILVGFSGPIGLMDALEQCLPRLAEVHLHDGPWQGSERTIHYGADHRPLGEGDLDLGPFLDRLAEVGFDGPIIFELTLDEALASMDVVRSIRPGTIN